MIERIIQRFDRRGLSDYVDIIGDMWQSGKPIKLTAEYYNPETPMTDKQRSALHVWCDQVAKVLNDAGLHMIRKAWDGDEMEIDWSKMLVKEFIYKPLLDAMTGKDSTEKQSTVNPSDVALHLTRHYAKRGIVLPPWPSFR